MYKTSAPPRYAIIIPACNEAACMRAVIDELRATLRPENFLLVVGVNGTTDRTADIALEAGALVAETHLRGYGHGCQAAVNLVKEYEPDIAGYIFLAADGANDPGDVHAFTMGHQFGADMVLGSRTKLLSNLPVMGFTHMLANRLLGAWCWLLTGRFFTDLGPLRFISRELFEAMRLHEWTYGWTIEAQIRAARLGAKIIELSVFERGRIAGEQKVSRVSWHHTLRIGIAIVAAGWRTRKEQTARERCGEAVFERRIADMPELPSDRTRL